MTAASVAVGAADPDAARRAASELRAVILLAGRVGKGSLATGLGRSVLDLPVSGERSILDVWRAHLEEFARALDLPRLRVFVAVDRSGPLPRPVASDHGTRVEFEVVRDPVAYRGTAGVVRDLTRSFAPADRVLVLTASLLPRVPLVDVFRTMAGPDDSVSLVPHRGSDLAIAFLVRCGRFSEVADVGFVDLKEQAIPAAHGVPVNGGGVPVNGGGVAVNGAALNGRAALRVSSCAPAAALPLRTLDEYVRALRTFSRPERRSEGVADDPFEETWKAAFRIVEPGSDVAGDSVLHDSVVFAGGRVAAGAVVVRSVICPGATVLPGQRVYEKVVTA